jgi:hypothetical protein
MIRRLSWQRGRSRGARGLASANSPVAISPLRISKRQPTVDIDPTAAVLTSANHLGEPHPFFRLMSAVDDATRVNGQTHARPYGVSRKPLFLLTVDHHVFNPRVDPMPRLQNVRTGNLSPSTCLVDYRLEVIAHVILFKVLPRSGAQQAMSACLLGGVRTQIADVSLSPSGKYRPWTRCDDARVRRRERPVSVLT